MKNGERIIFMKTKKGLELTANVSDIFNIPKGDKIQSIQVGEYFAAKKGKR